MSVFLWTATAIASALIGLLITILFQDQVSLFLIKILRGTKTGNGRRTLAGLWHSYYFVFAEKGTSPTARIPNRKIITVRLRQVGNRVAGTGIGASNGYSTLATFRDPYLTGSWQNSIDGIYSWGSFQLSWHTNSKWMAGKFVGKDSNNHINDGVWLWARERDELPALADWAVASGYIPNALEVHKLLRISLKASLESGLGFTGPAEDQEAGSLNE